ncbi:MAG: bifunctional hydroxymethylpyrimidine kinase/phosphomethylpyrimidine kinase [Candidatus Binatia bacterium]
MAANLAKGQDIVAAVTNAKSYITDALRHSYRIGSGHSPVHHFYRYWKA